MTKKFWPPREYRIDHTTRGRRYATQLTEDGSYDKSAQVTEHGSDHPTQRRRQLSLLEQAGRLPHGHSQARAQQSPGCWDPAATGARRLPAARVLRARPHWGSQASSTGWPAHVQPHLRHASGWNFAAQPQNPPVVYNNYNHEQFEY